METDCNVMSAGLALKLSLLRSGMSRRTYTDLLTSVICSLVRRSTMTSSRVESSPAPGSQIWETNERRQVKTEIRRAGHHQPDLGDKRKETSEDRDPESWAPRLAAGKTDRDPESRTHHQPERQMKGDKSRQRSGEPDTTSQTRRQMKGDK